MRAIENTIRSFHDLDTLYQRVVKASRGREKRVVNSVALCGRTSIPTHRERVVLLRPGAGISQIESAHQIEGFVRRQCEGIVDHLPVDRDGGNRQLRISRGDTGNRDRGCRGIAASCLIKDDKRGKLDGFFFLVCGGGRWRGLSQGEGRAEDGEREERANTHGDVCPRGGIPAG